MKLPRRNQFSAFLSLLVLALIASAAAAPPKSAGPAPDKAYLQKFWDSWSTLDPDNAAKYYAKGPHAFFDIAPLKYNSWGEYEKGSKELAAKYKSAKFTLNDDLAVHPHGDLVWVTATIGEEMTTTAGKVDMGNFRWTTIWENQNGRWLIVHEHVSVPMP